tara:strand:- start:85 stop:294 length:210 start_codon:yes stop_codon:yes gene_type:complete
MSYYSKTECYADVFMALTTGIVEETELYLLRQYYEDTEQYECCQGLVEAYIDYKKELEDVTEDKGISTD